MPQFTGCAFHTKYVNVQTFISIYVDIIFMLRSTSNKFTTDVRHLDHAVIRTCMAENSATKCVQTYIVCIVSQAHFVVFVIFFFRSKMSSSKTLRFRLKSTHFSFFSHVNVSRRTMADGSGTSNYNNTLESR